MEKSIFARIIDGEIPCYKVYEDDLVFAFLDINPVALGHTLVVPKEQIDHFDDLPHVTAANIAIAAQKISKALKSATGCARVGLIIAGFDVPHAHVHLIPANSTAEMTDFSRAHKRSEEEMREILGKIVGNLTQ